MSRYPNFRKNNKQYAAFTLIEISIAVIIIGLIVGGVIGGRSLINSAKINSEISNIRKMQAAVKAFELEFDDIPGDMTNAYDYFGANCGTDNSNAITGCNGTGDKCISQADNCTTNGNGINGDIYRALNHLAVSEIYPDLPNFMSYIYPNRCVIGEHLPETAVDSGTYLLHSETPNKIYMWFITSTLGANWCTLTAQTGYIKPKDAKSIDKKIDDGNGRRGLYQAKHSLWVNGGSFEGVDCMDANGNYAVSETGNNCAIRFEVK